MPSWAKKPSKPLALGMVGGVVGGVGSGLLWHIMTVYTDPPRILFYAVEALIGVVVALLLPRSPQTPNLNPIPLIH